jgi:anti-anti-sigma factor
MPSVTVEVNQRPGPGPGATVVRIGGTLEADTVAAARTLLDPVVAAAPRVAVFDFGGLSFLSSVGISLLIETRRRLEAVGTKIFVTNMQPQIARVMDIVQALPGNAVFKDTAEMDEYLAEMQRRVLEGDEPSA